MEPRNEEVSTANEPTQAQETEGRKPRFQVIKVEDSPEGHDVLVPTRGGGHTCRCCRCR